MPGAGSSRAFADRAVVTQNAIGTHIGEFLIALGLRELEGEDRRVAAVPAPICELRSRRLRSAPEALIGRVARDAAVGERDRDCGEHAGALDGGPGFRA